MVTVNLYTKNDELVITVATPPFDPMPDCIVWGNRFFFKHIQAFEKKDPNGYYEGFAVAAIPAVNVPERLVQKEKKEEFGNNDLLFGLPNDLDEAIETFLEFYSKSSDFKLIDELSEDEFVTTAHHGAGQFVRNSWYLWWHEGHNCASWPKDKPALVQWFNNLGIYHADDMSSIIITSAHRQHHKRDIAIEKQVEHFKNFWKSQGFADGIYKPQ